MVIFPELSKDIFGLLPVNKVNVTKLEGTGTLFSKSFEITFPINPVVLQLIFE